MAKNTVDVSFYHLKETLYTMFTSAAIFRRNGAIPGAVVMLR